MRMPSEQADLRNGALRARRAVSPSMAARASLVSLGSAAAIVLLVLLGVATAAPDAIAEDTSVPRAIVRKTIDDVLAVLSEDGLDKQVKQQRIETIAYAHFDFDTMSKLVLAKNWRRLSDDEKTEFVGEFKMLLSRSYGSRLDRWGDEKVAMVGEQVEPRGDVTVRTRIVGGGFDGAELDYRLRKSKNGEWRAIDVVIEGVSLVSSYRSQFKDAMSSGGAQKMLEQMRQKNQEPIEESDEPATAERTS
jgi:phospholipid transport system substrate-binding protein